MTWRVLASIAIHNHGLFAFFPTKLHSPSASASSRRMTTSVGLTGSWTCQCSGQAAKHSTIKCKSQVRLTPTARQIPRRETLAQQVLNQCVLLGRNDAVFGAGHKLASACRALMILFAAVNMAVFLELCRSTRWTRVADNHGCCSNRVKIRFPLVGS
jgi:hypothetical protein